MWSIKPKSKASKLKIRTLLKDHRLLITCTLIILITGLFFLPSYKYRLNPDSVSYISIADKYAHLNFKDAINSYWGPLFSWLAVPAFWLGLQPIIYMKTVQILLVTILMLLLYASMRRYVGSIFASLGAFIGGIIGLEAALPGALTPDLIVAVLTLALFTLITRNSENNSRNFYILIGVIGSLLYFAKSAGFFLFLGIMTIWIVSDLLFRKDDSRSKVITRKIPALVTFIVLILPFVILISIKNGHPTIGTSGVYNLSLVGPNTEGHPMTKRLIPPPNPTAVSAWEDISKVPVNNWNPLASSHNLKHFIENIRYNLTELNKILLKYIWPLLILGVFYLATPTKKKEELRYKFMLTGAILTTLLLYLPLLLEVRYILFVSLAAVIAFTLLIGQQQYHYKFRQLLPLYLVSGIITAGVISVPWQHIINDRKFANIVYMEAQSIRPYVPKDQHLASDDFGSIFVCYFLNVKCYGVVNPNDPDVDHQLSTYAIKYLLLKPESAQSLGTKVSLEKIEGPAFEYDSLYKVGKNP